MQKQVSKIPSREFLAIAAVWNVQLQVLTETRQPYIGPHRLENEPEQEIGGIQESWSTFIAFVIVYQMRVCNTWSDLAPEYLCTYKHHKPWPGGPPFSREQYRTPDFILTPCMWKQRRTQSLGGHRMRIGLRPLSTSHKGESKSHTQSQFSETQHTSTPALH